MPPRISQDRSFIRALNRFERAVSRLDDLGAIPLFGQDRAEQAAIDAARDEIRAEYDRAKRCLLNLIDRRIATSA